MPIDGKEFDFEAEAKVLGWVPKDQWKGDEEKWVDAEAFVTHGETVLPILVKNKRELAARFRSQEEALSQIREDTKGFRDMMERNAVREKAELQAQIDSFQAERAQAITDGEGKAAVAAEKEIHKLEKQQDELDKPPVKKEEAIHPDYPAWLSENTWYRDDPELQMMANAIAAQIASRNPTLKGRPFFDAIKERVAKLDTYLEKFPEDKPRRINSVESPDDTDRSSEGRARGGKGKSYESLPPDAKATCDRYIKNGWFSDKQYKTIAEKRAAYVAIYFEEKQ